MNAIVPIKPVLAVAPGSPFEGAWEFDGKMLRYFHDGAKMLIVAPDVAKALGYRTAGDMTRTLDADEQGTHTVRTPGGRQAVKVISDAGLYRVLTQRRGMKTLSVETRERIAAFQRWLYHDVLPTIRATGAYNPAPAKVLSQVDLLNPDVLLPLLASYAQGNVALKAQLVIEQQAHGATTAALVDAHVQADRDRPKVIA